MGSGQESGGHDGEIEWVRWKLVEWRGVGVGSHQLVMARGKATS